MGIAMITFAVHVIPGSESIWPAIRNCQCEISDYDRYSAWCESMQQEPLPFYEWANWARRV
jgi:hypothetical protein